MKTDTLSSGINQSDLEADFILDFIKVQSEIGAFHKNEANPFFKSKYVPLPEILRQIKPVLNSNNFILIQKPSFDDNHEVLLTEIIHVSGQRISCVTPLKMDEKDKNNPQKYGSAITYMRRYSLTSLLALEESDDDGEQAKPNPSPGIGHSDTSKPDYRKINETVFERLSQGILSTENADELDLWAQDQGVKPKIENLKKYAPDLYAELKSRKERHLENLNNLTERVIESYIEAEIGGRR